MMRFSAEHRFDAPPAEVAAVLADPDLYRSLELPDLRLLEVHQLPAASALDARPGAQAPPETGVLLRYEFTGSLDPIAIRLLGGARLTWSQEVHLRDGEGGWLTFAAEGNPRLLHGRADFVLHAEGARAGPGARATLRRLDGELTVAIPVVGRMAERRIVSGVIGRLDVEAAAVQRWLGRRDRR
ncbi:MAG: DUF2505 family protein [Actinomycetota bacterium]|jgi:hypothetical protein|nr:DUF2505 family protein [Actinomycetota bacterium]